jgi:hypothetical protein
MRSLRILVACMAIIGVMSAVASSASAMEPRSVRAPNCVKVTCQRTLSSFSAVWETGEYSEECKLSMHLAIDGTGHTAATEVQAESGEAFCGVFFEAQNEPWSGKLCYDYLAQEYYLTMREVSFWSTLGYFTEYYPLPFTVVGTFEHPGEHYYQDSFELHGASVDADMESEFGPNQGHIAGKFQLDENVQLENGGNVC